VEEEIIKSALEIAMEKISALPELTAEEIAAQKEKEFGPVGEAIAKKFLNGTISESEFLGELDKYRGDEGHIVRRTIISSLCREICLDNDEVFAARALTGFGRMIPEKIYVFEHAKKDFQQILSEFRQEKEKKFRESDTLTRLSMRKIGIFGSAIRPNLSENKQWQQAIDKIRQDFEPRLKNLRNALMQELQFQ
jgi:hypothetical protein